jgi:peptidoglycan/LPS O-acetylase OafA/YrhL
MPNLIGLIANVLLAITVISAAFSFKTVSNRILGNTDISYGVYLYHMVIVNSFVMMGLLGEVKYLVSVVLLTIGFAIFSWNFIEKRFLRNIKIAK